jgi:hypothetical protein
MKLLSYNNWKKKLPFDNIVYKDTKRYSHKLNSHEREIMDIQIDFYREHFSLLQVMNHFKILKTKEDKETFIRAVLKRKENLLFIPQCLVLYFKNKIKKEFSEYRAFFEILLNKAIEQPNRNLIIPIIKKIMGLYYKPVLRQVNKYRKMKEIKVRQKTLSPASYENLARDYIHNLQNDLVLSAIYGRSSIRKTVPISIVDDNGYGEWLSKNVSFNTNRLFIYSNNNKLTDVQLEHMIYFNVYPGYGYFYNTVVDEKNNLCFDNGATYLINGWAMYAMCRSKNTAHSTSMLIEGSIIAHHLLRKNIVKAYEDIYIYLLGRYPKSKAIDYMLDYTQYPGNYLSYVLGAFATEEAINSEFANNPVDYLKTLSSINCGDFFALYHPKIQKKIAKTHFTAKVAKKFNTVKED